MRWFLVALALALPGGALAEEPVDRSLWLKIDKATSGVEQITYTMIKQERLRPNDEMLPAETYNVKFRKPYDLYMDVVGGPHKGRHMLYRQGWDALKVHVFSRAFQWMV